MAGYKRPRSWSFIGEQDMPRTATGKIQHRRLREVQLADWSRAPQSG
jgi:acyl-CoA synthetase (AMP-forming)/AMP-acid ligase II